MKRSRECGRVQAGLWVCGRAQSRHQPPSGATPAQAAVGLSEAGCAPCTHLHDLVLLLAAVLGQDGQDGRGQQDALQQVDHAVGSPHVHPPQRDALGPQQDAPL